MKEQSDTFKHEVTGSQFSVQCNHNFLIHIKADQRKAY